METSGEMAETVWLSWLERISNVTDPLGGMVSVWMVSIRASGALIG
jgi:hypothetical protein